MTQAAELDLERRPGWQLLVTVTRRVTGTSKVELQVQVNPAESFESESRMPGPSAARAASVSDQSLIHDRIMHAGPGRVLRNIPNFRSTT